MDALSATEYKGEVVPMAQEYTGPVTMNPNIAAQGAKAEGVRETAAGVLDSLNRRDPGIDYKTGVSNVAFRAGFSRMDNEAERTKFLDRVVGPGEWGKDSFGAYFIKPSGLKRIGMVGDKPLAIDEQKTTLRDAADYAGSIPSIAGAVAGGMAATGMGAIPAMGLAGLGAAGGKALDEVVKNLQGQQVKTAGEVFQGVLDESNAAAVGEGGARVLSKIGGKILAPAASRMTPEKATAAKDAIEQGFKIRPGSVTDAPLLARWEGMVRNIFGDLYEDQNVAAAKAGAARLGGGTATKEQAGEAITNSIRKQRVNFSQAMSRQYQGIDDLVGQPFVPTDSLKATAQAILDGVPKTRGGDSAFIAGETRKFLSEVLNLTPLTSVSQMQRVRTMLREAADSPDLVPGLSKHDARLLRDAADRAFDDAANTIGIQKTSQLLGADGKPIQTFTPLDPAKSQAAIAQLRAADNAYRQGIKQFDLPVITAITRNASRTGSVDADMVVDHFLKPERVVRLRQVKALAEPAAWEKVKTAHANDLLSNVVQGTADPLKKVFDGKAFRDSLDKYGREVLEEVHGKQWVDDAYKYANSLMLANKKMSLSGGIVAANVALHPIANLPKLVWLRAVAKVMEQPGTFKYLTEGFQLGPNTAKGAEAINRVLTQALALAKDRTGSATVTLTEPE